MLGVASNQYAWAGFYQLRVDELTRELGEDAWERLSFGEGSKGPRVYDWASARLNCPVEGWERWALARRSISEPAELAYYLVFVPAGASLDEVVRAAGRRWTIEEAIEEAKGEVGLDQYEVRSWRGWYRHITLSMLGHAYLAVTRIGANSEAAKGGRRDRQGRAVWSSSGGSGASRADTAERGGDQETAVAVQETAVVVGVGVQARSGVHLGWSVWRRRHQAVAYPWWRWAGATSRSCKMRPDRRTDCWRSRERAGSTYIPTSSSGAAIAKENEVSAAVTSPMADWAGVRHAFRCDNLIVLYPGQAQQVEDILTELCGPPFAQKDP